jgi:hypothetical protein
VGEDDGGTRMQPREVREPGYDIPAARLSTNLRWLRDLNIELRRSIDEIGQKRREEFIKNATQDKSVLQELNETVKTIMETMTRSKELNKELRVQREVSDKALSLLHEAEKALIWPSEYTNFIRDMSLVYLVAEFESCLEQVLKITFEWKPEILASSGKSIAIRDLMKLENIKDVKKQAAKKESLSLSTQSVDEINTYIKKKFGVELSKFSDWRQFRERFYRRNLIIHNSGEVDETYRSKTGYRGKDIKLKVTEKYLSKSIDMFETTFIKIAQSFQDKFWKSESK